MRLVPYNNGVSRWVYRARRYGPLIGAAYRSGKAAFPYVKQAYETVKPYFKSRKRARPNIPRPIGYYHTRGTYAGGVRKGARPKVNKYKLHGSEMVTQHGGVYSNAEVATIGHYDTPLLELHRSVFRAVYRRLMVKMGYIVSSWDDVCPIPAGVAPAGGDFRITYKPTPSSAPTEVVFHVDLVLAHVGVADAIADLWLDTVGTTTVPVTFLTFGCRRSSTDLYEGVLLKNIMVHLKCSSTMVFQNRTLGASATDDQLTDVTNNPLSGRSWTVTGNQMIANNTGSQLAFSTANVQHGSLAGAGYDPDELTAIRKMQGPTAYKYCIGTSRVRLAPGNLKKSYLCTRRSISWTRLFELINPYVQHGDSTKNTPRIRVALGRSRLFSFEKLCDTGAGDQNLAVGYEINSMVSSYVTLHAAECNRLVQTV